MKVRRSSSEKTPTAYFALSIKQPWAQLIIEGRKDVEVRSWTTLYRGPIWIHTGQKLDTQANERFNEHGLFRGGIIGCAELWGIRPFSENSWEAWRSRHLDDSTFNEELAKYGWILRNAKPLDQPIAVKGMTGLFRLPNAVEKLLHRRLKSLRGRADGSVSCWTLPRC